MERKNKPQKITLNIIYCILLGIGCVVFGVLCFHSTKILAIQKNIPLFTITWIVVVAILCWLGILGIYKQKETLYKSITTLLVGILFCLIMLLILLKTGFFALVKDKQTLANYLQKYGGWMPVAYILLQYLQVVILPIPSVVSTAVGVLLFGAFQTIIYSLIGILLGSFTAFWIGRKLGNKAVAWLIGEDSLATWQKKLKGKDNFILTLMFLLPMFPDDILCFVAGLSSMSVPYFSIMIILSRLFAITTTCYSIQLIPLNTWWGVCIWGILFISIILAFVFVYKNMDKIQTKISSWNKRNRK